MQDFSYCPCCCCSLFSSQFFFCNHHHSSRRNEKFEYFYKCCYSSWLYGGTLHHMSISFNTTRKFPIFFSPYIIYNKNNTKEPFPKVLSQMFETSISIARSLLHDLSWGGGPHLLKPVVQWQQQNTFSIGF